MNSPEKLHINLNDYTEGLLGATVWIVDKMVVLQKKKRQDGR